MNKLIVLTEMGFKISWKLINIGLFGDGEIPPILTREDIVEYLYSLLTEFNEQTDKIIALICEKDDFTEFDRVLKKLASEDVSDIVIQKRKWKAYMLKVLIDNINRDCLQGLLEFIEFWISMGNPDDCPQIFPNGDNPKSVQDFFTQTTYELSVNKNIEWLDKEICSIVEFDKTEDGKTTDKRVILNRTEIQNEN